MNLPSFLTQTPWLTATFGALLALFLAVTLALFGWFYPALTLLSLALLFGALTLAIRTLIQRRDTVRLSILAGLLLLAVIIGLRTEPTVFTGRDQGSIAIAALELAKNHELAFRSLGATAFFDIYGPGRALNFPGFSYTEDGALLTQFPLGYTSYLALFASWFGVNGLVIANMLLFFLSSWTFFELSTLFVSRRSALLGTGLFSTSFVTLWLSTLTLTENLALLLYLSLTLALTKLGRDKEAHFLPLILVATPLFALTRIEGFAIAALVVVFLLSQKTTRQAFFALPKPLLIFGGLFLALLFLRDLFMNLPFYTAIGKAVLKYWHELGETGSGSSDPALGPILFSYGLFPIFLLGIASLLFGVMQRRFTLFIPLLIAAPTLLYLMNGHISDDHPWLLRRYAFTLFPLFLLATLCLIENVSKRFDTLWGARFFFGAFVLLFIAQAPPALTALRTIELDTLLQETERLSQTFSNRDLILIDRGSSGDPFALLAGPLASLYEKNAVYFFNPEDYGRIDRGAFDRIYLLADENSLGRYFDAFGEELLPIRSFTFSYPVLRAEGETRAPKEKRITHDALLFQITP